MNSQEVSTIQLNYKSQKINKNAQKIKCYLYDTS